MKTTRWLVAAVSLLLVASGAFAEDVAGLPLHVKRLDPTTVRVWVGDYISSTATVAFATSRGIVVVDTTGNPRIDAELRKVIARELGRSDFKVLINTHEHGDHTGGNSVYSDCEIVGHELVGKGMTPNSRNREQVAAWHASRTAELEKNLANLPADSPEGKRLREEVLVNRLGLEALKANPKPVPPTRTFADRMTLSMGDTTFELSYIGGMHTASDIAIFVPEHGILMTGDTMADVWLTDTPGCLASFIAREGVRHDFPLLLENWGLLLQKKDQIKMLITGHWNGELTLKGFEDRVNYVRSLWEGVNKAVAEGKSLADIQTAYRLDTRFPELARSPGCNLRNNYSTILEMWQVVTKQESAAARLYALIDEGAGEDAIHQVVADRNSTPSRYFFLEDQINGYGYRFLQQDKVPQAIAMFKANVELFPGSWNVFDSLGEALLKAGDVAGATAMYEKSLALNPESPSGKEALAKIRGTATK
ncbi:MAG: MBL fold metallo-hydrolase [Thermoanaerobaculaceae bacterium]|jgi:glyoxylase-like metal-dependent hydrolase (beta-lactamase superfamily II)|nr:MBL fold metallo-hydrolase [Thermoanaerobaculaceae bacterium]